MHSVANEHDTVRVSVRGRQEGARLILEVENTAGQGRPARGGSGIGLGATRERLRAMFGDEQDVELSRSASGSYIARVRIPLNLARAAA
jgi:LytS/YehU family sensor histidine kinase